MCQGPKPRAPSCSSQSHTKRPNGCLHPTQAPPGLSSPNDATQHAVYHAVPSVPRPLLSWKPKSCRLRPTTRPKCPKCGHLCAVPPTMEGQGSTVLPLCPPPPVHVFLHLQNPDACADVETHVAARPWLSAPGSVFCETVLVAKNFGSALELSQLQKCPRPQLRARPCELTAT